MLINYKSDNFSLEEVIHHNPDNLPKQLEGIAHFVMGRLEGFRTFLRFKTGREIRVLIKSGYRSPLYNQSIGGSDNSYHMWRYDPLGKIVWAVDVNSPDLDTDILFEYAKQFFDGEVYWHRRFNFIHLTDYGITETWII